MPESMKDFLPEREEEKEKPYARYYGSEIIHRMKRNRVTGELFPKKTICGRELQEDRHAKISKDREEDFDKCRRCWNK